MTDVNEFASVTDAELDEHIADIDDREGLGEVGPWTMSRKVATELRAARATLAAYEVARGAEAVENVMDLAEDYASAKAMDCHDGLIPYAGNLRDAVTALVVDRDKAVDERDRAYAALVALSREIHVSRHAWLQTWLENSSHADVIAAAKEAGKGGTT